eukprot:scaffold110_cov285-Alexandrium_tamarense.AAC.3
MIQQPRVNSLSVRTWNNMCFKGNVVFGGRTVATWVLGGVARDSSDGWEVEKGILLHNWRSRSSHIPQLAPHPLRQHADQHIGAGARHQHRISMLPTFKYKPPTANATTPVTKVPHFQQILIKAVVMPWVVRSSMGGWSSIVTATGRKGGERRVRLEGTPQRPIYDQQRLGDNRNNCGQRPSNRLVGFSRSSQLFHVPKLFSFCRHYELVEENASLKQKWSWQGTRGCLTNGLRQMREDLLIGV